MKESCKGRMESISSLIVDRSPGHLVHGALYYAALKQSRAAQLTALSREISPLLPTDAKAFRKAFQQEGICYANSWLYVLRSTRDDQGRLGYKFVGNETLIGIGYRNGTVYLVRPIGKGRFDDTLDLCKKICSSMNCPVVLKKVDRELHKYLMSTGLFHTSVDELTVFEEEAFPEHVLQLEELYDPDFITDRRSLPLMRKVKRFA